jgi:DNA-binding LacI/PurR family transcriptional regulator
MRADNLEPGPLVVGDFTYAGGERAAESMLALDERPTAVFCANDLSAVGFIRRAQDLGLDVPGDISVVGYDGIQLGTYTRPTLTTVAATPRLLAMHAAQMLLDVIEGRPVDDVEVAPATVIVRDSTGPVPVGTPV